MGLYEVFKQIKICFWDKYADFNGKASREEYWVFSIFVIIFNLVLKPLLIFAIFKFHSLAILIYTALVIPHLAVAVRRFHDTGRSGKEIVFYNLLLFFVSFLIIQNTKFDYDYSYDFSYRIKITEESLSAIIALGCIPLVRCGYILLSKSQPEENKYGLPPE